MARVSRGKFRWLRNQYLFFKVSHIKLTDEQIAAFDLPRDPDRKLITGNPKLNELLSRPVRWGEICGNA